MQEKQERLFDELTIEKFKEQFNSPETVKVEGDSFISWLVKQDKGLATLSKEPHILNQENLNADLHHDYPGKTVLWWLTSHKDGLKILIDHPELFTPGKFGCSTRTWSCCRTNGIVGSSKYF